MQDSSSAAWRASAAYLYVLRLDTAGIALEYLRRYAGVQTRLVSGFPSTAVNRPTARAILHMRALQALDGVNAGATHREIAEVLFGREAVAFDWHPDSYLRARVRYLLNRGRNVMEGNYRRLVRSPSKFLPPGAAQPARISVRPVPTRKRIPMFNIGTFTRKGDGYRGTIRTLTLNAEAEFIPCASAKTRAPDYRVVSNGLECGAAWNKDPDSSRPYLTVKLDDPSFPAPIYARLIAQDDGTATLIWSRQSSE